MTFRLARMSPLVLGMTLFVLAIPAVMIGAAVSSPLAPRIVLFAVSVLCVALYTLVWLMMRPRRFELTGTALRIVWPARQREVPLSAIGTARVIDRREFRQTWGYGARLGAGGLWGGFGQLRTRNGTFELLVSRMDRYVIVERTDGEPPLLITPEEPERFCAELNQAPRG